MAEGGRTLRYRFAVSLFTSGSSGLTWVILGAGGHAAAVADVLEQRGDMVLAVAGTTDRDWPCPVLDSDSEAVELAERTGSLLVLAVGDNAVRQRLMAAAPSLIGTVTSPVAHVSRAAVLGHGTVVMSGAHVGPGAVVGEASLINTGAIVEHDTVLGSSAHIGPGAVLGGGCSAGVRTLVGAGAVVLPGVSIGDDVVIGAGAVVTKPVLGGRVVVGNPARVLEEF
ncbi:MAG: acetyltransferase [Propionibacteriaceae bacterium]|nr:acetyltransferase [Propionibacteriaceae bacterium]